MMLYGSGWNCSPFWGTVLDIYKTLSCKSLIQKKIPTYLPTSKMMGRSTANIQFFKDGLICFLVVKELRVNMLKILMVFGCCNFLTSTVECLVHVFF